MQGQALYPAICLKNAELAVNFGAQPFKHPPPPGFVGLAQAPRSATASWQDAPAAGDGSRKPLAVILEPARWAGKRAQARLRLASPASPLLFLHHSCTALGATPLCPLPRHPRPPQPAAPCIPAPRNPTTHTAHACRDLAEQTHTNISLFRKHLAAPSVRNELMVGGTNPAAQLRSLKEGVDIVVGTPGAAGGGGAGWSYG